MRLIPVQRPPAPIRISARIGCLRDGVSYHDPEQFLRDAGCALCRSQIGGRYRTTVYAATMSATRRTAERLARYPG